MGCTTSRWPKTSYNKSQRSYKKPPCLCAYGNVYIPSKVYFSETHTGLTALTDLIIGYNLIAAWY